MGLLDREQVQKVESQSLLQNAMKISRDRHLPKRSLTKGTVYDLLHNKCNETVTDTILQLGFSITPPEKLFMLSTSEHVKWQQHSLVVMSDKSGHWFAGSPSDIPQQWQKSLEPYDGYTAATTSPWLVEATTIEELLQKIHEQDPLGAWPHANELSRLIPYIKPVEQRHNSAYATFTKLHKSTQGTQCIHQTTQIPFELVNQLPRVLSLNPNEGYRT